MQNDMKDRLIDLLINANVYDSYECKLCTKEDYCDYCNAEKLANYLIANGVIVPHCKMGDKIYMLVTRQTTRFDFPNGKMEKVISHHTFIKETTLTKSNFFNVIESFGKTVFLTKEHAEQKLKEMRVENG